MIRHKFQPGGVKWHKAYKDWPKMAKAMRALTVRVFKEVPILIALGEENSELVPPSLPSSCGTSGLVAASTEQDPLVTYLHPGMLRPDGNY